jgi:type VI secretion system protein ImpB
MPSVESTHDKLKRVRKPHVHITYEVYKPDGGMEVRELPFVVGVMGDFSGNPTAPLKPLRDRQFVSIDRDNFNEVMRNMTPGLNLKVENTLAGDGTEMPINLKFDSMDDFSPARVAEQVPALKKLLETREQLKSLMAKADNSAKLEGLLEQILANGEEIKKASSQLGVESGGKGE